MELLVEQSYIKIATIRSQSQINLRKLKIYVLLSCFDKNCSNLFVCYHEL